MSKLTKALTAAAGNAGGANLYVEDVFSTYLYAGNDNVAFDITNNIDLAGEGGLVWIKVRNATFDPNLFDTERGANNWLESSASLSQQTATNKVNAFNADGFSLGTHSGVNGGTDKDYVSWSFRKAEKFFDVVKWTGDGTASRQLSHGLNAIPGLFIIKNLTASDPWIVWHKDLGDFAGAGKNLILNTTAATDTGNLVGTLAQQTSTYITVKKDVTKINNDGHEYIAYLFASDAGGFGDDGSENIIKCGSYTGDGGAGTTEVNLGFEPQWILVKATSAGDNGFIIDNMRGWATESNTSNDAYLLPNSNNAESTGGFLDITSTGFKTTLYTNVNVSGRTYIYVAIRRPMKTPEAGTEVFAPISLGTTTEPGHISGFVTDFTLHNTVDETGSTQVSSRMTGNGYMLSDSQNAEGTINSVQWDFMNGSRVGNGTANSDEIQWMFKRATGFMDVVAYSGTGSSLNPVHNLGVTPELKIIKCRSTSGTEWVVGGDIITGGTTNDYIVLDSSAAKVTNSNYWTSGADSATTFSTRTGNGFSNSSGRTYVAYLFATLAGVSKVGSYVGNGSSQNIDCGFTNGARFVLLKVLSPNSGGWIVVDTTRGIIAGDDPFLTLNTTSAEDTTTDIVDPYSGGFAVTAENKGNQNGTTYIFLAIA